MTTQKNVSSRDRDSAPSLEQPRRFPVLACVRVAAAASLGLAFTAAAPVATAAGSTATAAPLTQISLPGSPFGTVASPDHRFVFTSLSGATNGIAVIRTEGNTSTLVRVVPTAGGAWGLALSHDGRLLVAAVQPQGLAFIDTHAAETGATNAVLGYVPLGDDAGAIEAHFSKDEKFVFSSEENVEAVAVVDVHQAFATGFDASSVVGEVPVEQLPVGLAISPDGRYLYVTSEEANAGEPGYDPTVCNIPSGNSTVPGPEGTITVIDVHRATVDPATSIVSRAYAGCVPVRIVLSPGGEIAWVSQRAANSLGAFSTGRLLSDPAHALISATPVGIAPVGVQLFAGGLLIAVANSNRFATATGTVSIVDATRALFGRSNAVVDTIDVGHFPREWSISPSGNELYLTEFNSSAFDTFDVRALVKDVLTGSATP